MSPVPWSGPDFRCSFRKVSFTLGSVQNFQLKTWPTIFVFLLKHDSVFPHLYCVSPLILFKPSSFTSHVHTLHPLSTPLHRSRFRALRNIQHEAVNCMYYQPLGTFLKLIHSLSWFKCKIVILRPRLYTLLKLSLYYHRPSVHLLVMLIIYSLVQSPSSVFLTKVSIGPLT